MELLPPPPPVENLAYECKARQIHAATQQQCRLFSVVISYQLEKDAQGKCCPVRSIGLRVATYWKEQTRRSQNYIYLGFKIGFHQWIQRIFMVVVEAERNVFRKIFVLKIWMHFTAL